MSQDRTKNEPRLIQIETKQCHNSPQFILCPNPKWTGPSHTQVDRPGVFQGQTLAADSGKQKQETPQAWLGSVLINLSFHRNVHKRTAVASRWARQIAWPVSRERCWRDNQETSASVAQAKGKETVTSHPVAQQAPESDAHSHCNLSGTLGKAIRMEIFREGNLFISGCLGLPLACSSNAFRALWSLWGALRVALECAWFAQGAP